MTLSHSLYSIIQIVLHPNLLVLTVWIVHVPNRGVPMGRGYPLGRGGKGKDGEPKPDLQKLGMKFGGQISITSTGNQAKKSDRGNDGQVVLDIILVLQFSAEN